LTQYSLLKNWALSQNGWGLRDFQKKNWAKYKGMASNCNRCSQEASEPCSVSDSGDVHAAPMLQAQLLSLKPLLKDLQITSKAPKKM
jgi:hypothetical protein